MRGAFPHLRPERSLYHWGSAFTSLPGSGTRRVVKLKQRPEDFVVREGYRFDPDPEGSVWVYRLDKQKVSTLQALERISKEFAVRRRDLSICGLKDEQGRTEQLVGVLGGALGPTEVVQIR